MKSPLGTCLQTQPLELGPGRCTVPSAPLPLGLSSCPGAAHLHSLCAPPHGPPAGWPCPATLSHSGAQTRLTPTDLWVLCVFSFGNKVPPPPGIGLVLGRQLALNKCLLPGVWV